MTVMMKNALFGGVNAAVLTYSHIARFCNNSTLNSVPLRAAYCGA